MGIQCASFGPSTSFVRDKAAHPRRGRRHAARVKPGGALASHQHQDDGPGSAGWSRAGGVPALAGRKTTSAEGEATVAEIAVDPEAPAAEGNDLLGASGMVAPVADGVFLVSRDLKKEARTSVWFSGVVGFPSAACFLAKTDGRAIY
ncbi:hypothetical protein CAUPRSCDRAFT_12232 [Caulochytrium protostelioides]|uniref:Uncharacterized protein n=1 Tax=Caulochytrium protostelioides TaxID=1555241 RepID=A0A4V1IT74_9FUNG|nr:hypothetical protein CAUPRSCDRAFT_12232 [Caulochytrium protostelioides]